MVWTKEEWYIRDLEIYSSSFKVRIFNAKHAHITCIKYDKRSCL